MSAASIAEAIALNSLATKAHGATRRLQVTTKVDSEQTLSETPLAVLITRYTRLKLQFIRLPPPFGDASDIRCHQRWK